VWRECRGERKRVSRAILIVIFFILFIFITTTTTAIITAKFFSFLFLSFTGGQELIIVFLVFVSLVFGCPISLLILIIFSIMVSV